MDGIGMLIHEDNSLQGEVYSGSDYERLKLEEKINKHTILNTTVAYDGNILKNYMNGEMKGELTCSGVISYPQLNTVMAIGANPHGSTLPDGDYADIMLYSVRIYSRGLSAEEIKINSKADERRYKQENIIPVYTAEQLQKVGSGESVYVEQENKTYVYNNGAKYEYKNNIDTNTDYTVIADKINKGEIFIKINENEIKNGDNYYKYNSQYTIATNKYGYVLEGLELLLDGIDNTGDGHSNTTTIWKDLSGNEKNGTLKNMTASSAWQDNSIKLEADDYILIAPMNYTNVTMELVMSQESTKNKLQGIFSNVDTGGYNILAKANNKLVFSVYIKELNDYKEPEQRSNSLYLVENNKKYSISGTYNGKRIVSRVNSGYEYLDVTGTIKSPNNSTYMILGGNPTGTTIQEDERFEGTIYSARIYSRALTDEEQSTNYLADKYRYNL